MRSWLMYWRRPNTKQTDVMNHAASDQFHKVEPGDEVWFVTINDGELLLFGHMRVGERIPHSEAKTRFGDVWPAKYHIVAEGAAERYLDIPITKVASDLRFEGGKDRLPSVFSGRNLETMRELAPNGIVILRRAWNASGNSPVSQIRKVLSDCCVSALVKRERLGEFALTGRAKFTEAKEWKSAEELLDESKNNGTLVPVILSDAAYNSEPLLLWGVLRRLEITEARNHGG